MRALLVVLTLAFAGTAVAGPPIIFKRLYDVPVISCPDNGAPCTERLIPKRPK